MHSPYKVCVVCRKNQQVVYCARATSPSVVGYLYAACLIMSPLDSLTMCRSDPGCVFQKLQEFFWYDCQLIRRLLFKTRNLNWRVIAPICRLAIQLLQASSVISDHHGERHFDDLTNLPITKRESDNVLIFTLRFWNIVRRYVLWAESW
jgi:hypothetical protein